MTYIKLNGQAVELENIREFVKENSIAHIDIQLQSGPVKEKGVDGCQIDDVFFLLLETIRAFNDAIPSNENAMVIARLEDCMYWLKKRTADREARNVEGTTRL